MDIVTHTLSGLAVGTVVSAYSQKGYKDKLAILLVSSIAGALPDIDAISLWSKFDSTIGRFFGLNHSGQDIYFSKFWYSHHGFSHSLFAGILFAVLLIITLFLLKYKFKNFSLSNLYLNFKTHKFIFVGFVLGYFIHLLEDMLTPGSVWRGINLFWPFKTYIGGAGYIWWWNNYDIFLIVVAVIKTNTVLHLSNRFLLFSLKKNTLGVFLMGLVFATIQINSRDFDFAYSGHTSKYNLYEQKSKDIQKDILGEKIFNIMVRFDNRLKVYF